MTSIATQETPNGTAVDWIDKVTDGVGAHALTGRSLQFIDRQDSGELPC
jgi:hypothetical protein